LYNNSIIIILKQQLFSVGIVLSDCWGERTRRSAVHKANFVVGLPDKTWCWRRSLLCERSAC